MRHPGGTNEAPGRELMEIDYETCVGRRGAHRFGHIAIVHAQHDHVRSCRSCQNPKSNQIQTSGGPIVDKGHIHAHHREASSTMHTQGASQQLRNALG